MDNKRIDLNSYLSKGANIIFHISVIIICLGYVLDIIAYQKTSKRLIIINAITLLIIFVVFTLFRLKKLSIKTSFAIIIYSIIANIYTDTFTDLYLPTRVYFLMRDSLFIIIVLTLSSLVINKIHSIIIASIFLTGILIFALVTKNAFLLSSIYLIVTIVTSYAAVVYYFVNVIEKSISATEEDSKIIKGQNEIVNEANKLLIDRQKKIQIQTEELKEQSIILTEQSELLQINNEELNRLNATKDKFFSIVAHDLKNPFNTILGFAELLEVKFEKLDDNKKRSFIGNIKNIASKTYNLLENLLLWARLQSGKLDFDPQNIVISDLLEAIFPAFQKMYTDKKLEIINEIDEQCVVYADRDMLDKILRNLFSNAIKYTASEGKVNLKYKIVAHMVQIDISDTGIGISEEHIQHLFRIDKSRKTPGTEGETGTGLGLILCNEFVRKNGGELKVESREGVGSTFSFTLPAAVL